MTVTSRTHTPTVISKSDSAYLWSKIRTYCARFGIGREEQAAVMGVSVNTISNWNKAPDKVTFGAVSKFMTAYHLDWSSLISF